MLPDLKTGVTFPTFQSSGKWPVRSDCGNNNDKITEEIDFVFLRILELISSTPAEEDSFNFSITDNTPDGINVIGDIKDRIQFGNAGNGIWVSLVKTDEKAALNSSALSAVLISSPASFFNVTVRDSCGLMICQNFLGLLVRILGKSV